MTTAIKEINDIKELRKAIGQIKKDAGVKKGELKVRTKDVGGYGLSVDIEVMKYTATAAAAVKAMMSLAHGDQDDDIMTDYFGSDHLSVQWGFKFSDNDELKEWYTTDADIKLVEKVLSQRQDFLEPISDKTSASWFEKPQGEQKGFTCLTLYKTEGFERLTYFTVYDHDINRVYEFANAIARYRFLHEI